jgi:glycosyltransferase involved in cell wall biosynthesis
VNRVKIAYIIGSLAAGGAERQLLELLKGIDRQRFAPSLILFDCATAHRASGLVEDIFDLNISAESNSKWILKGSTFVRAVWDLAGYLKRTRPDIVQAILPASNILAAAAAVFSAVPVFIGCRRSLAGAYRTTRFLSALDRRAAHRCDVMVGNSTAILRELVELDGLSPRRVIRIPNGVDTGKFRPGSRIERQRYGWTEEHIVFGILANFLPYKRHIDFLRAAERIADLNRNARFLMIGQDRGLLESLKAEIRNRHLEPLVTIIPGTNEPETLYRAMDVYLCTSETEGLSNVLLEAGASGLPIVATRVGGNPEIVLDGYNGLLVEPCLPETVAAAAVQLAGNGLMRRQMGVRSRERVSAEFSIRAMVSAHENLYEKFLPRVNALKQGLERPVPIASHS